MLTAPLPSPSPGTHDAVRRWRAPDEALDLALLPMQGMLGLGAGDDGGSCWGDSIISENREGRAPGWTPRSKFRSLYLGKNTGVGTISFSRASSRPRD